MANVEQIAEELDKLTLLEAAQLSKMLQEKWGVSAAAPMAVAAMPGAPGGGGAAAAALRGIRGRVCCLAAG
jgi:large subunit ribosomal protein L7/L12